VLLFVNQTRQRVEPKVVKSFSEWLKSFYRLRSSSEYFLYDRLAYCKADLKLSCLVGWLADWLVVWLLNSVSYPPPKLLIEVASYHYNYILLLTDLKKTGKNVSNPKTALCIENHLPVQLAHVQLAHDKLTSEANASLFFSPPEIPRNRPGIPM